MPIEFDDSRVDVGGVDDRRGRGGGIAIGGGAGVVGLIVFVLFQLLGGGGGGAGTLPLPGAVQEGSGETREQLQARCNAEGALQQHADCRMIKVYNIADDVWSAELERRGLRYARPRLAFFTSAVSTGCGQASSQVGPFYCPPDQEIYFDLGFLDQLQAQLDAEGDFAEAYILAHEFGHHLQTLLGTERQVRAAQQRQPGQANELSVRMELQADCYAGVWAVLADRLEGGGIALSEANIGEAVNAAEAVGDDRIQAKSQGRVDPESWTHGSAEQRREWFVKGYRSANMDSCDTFR